MTQPRPSPYPRTGGTHRAYQRLAHTDHPEPPVQAGGTAVVIAHGDWPLPDREELAARGVLHEYFPGPCPNDICSTLHCVCDVPDDVLRHVMALLIGLHPRNADGTCACQYGGTWYGSPWTQCAHVGVYAKLTQPHPRTLAPTPSLEDYIGPLRPNGRGPDL